MQKIVHLHTDKKLIENSLKRYKCHSYHNLLIYFGKQPLQNSYSAKTVFLNYNLNGIREALKYCENADLVVVYDLDTIKSILVNRLSSDTKIAWRFFGYELYSRKSNQYFSELTNNFFRLSTLENLLKVSHNFWKKIKSYLKWRTDTEKEFLKAIKRIHIFMGLYQKEYKHLKKSWPILPTFVQIPPEEPCDYSYQVTNTKNKNVLLGNNRSAYNNHLDLLKIIEEKSVYENIRFSLTFSYGKNNKYTQAVRKKVQSLNKVSLKEKFKPFESYKKMYASSSSLVINGYRQMAMGNVFLALANGLKLYLNKNSSLYDYLKEENFYIYTIENFSRDIQTGNIDLEKELRIYNYDCLQELYNARTIEDLQDEINELIN